MRRTKEMMFLMLSALVVIVAAGCATNARTGKSADWRSLGSHTSSRAEMGKPSYTGSPTDFAPQAPLPGYTVELNGENEISFVNPNNYPVLVAIRSGNGGKDVKVPAQGNSNVALPAGSYRVFMVPAIDPAVCYRGDHFDLPRGNPIQMTIPSFVPIE